LSSANILEQLQKLLQLQKIDAEIYELKRQLKDKPAYLEELQKKFDAKRAILKALEEKVKTVLLARKSKEGDLKAKEELIAKTNSQLSLIKTNKEYTAKLTEIENIKADMSIIEEQILKSYDESDAVNAEVEKEKASFAVEEKKYQTEKKEIEDVIRSCQDRIKVFEAERQLGVPSVSKALLSRYEKILANKDGLAIVPIIDGHSCGGCYMNVPAQVVNEMTKHEDFVLCEMCARILYLKEDLDKK